MGDRVALQAILEGILGSNFVYYQPPESIKLVYPCIVYYRSSLRTTYANNSPYSLQKLYTITLIEKDPDSSLSEEILRLATSKHDRSYTVNNLYHNVFTLFF